MKKLKEILNSTIIGGLIVGIILYFIFGTSSNIEVNNSSDTIINTGKIDVNIKDSIDNSITIGGDINTKNNILENNYGNLTINIHQTINQVPNCPDCPDIEYHPMTLHHAILISCLECEGFSNIEIDINKVKFNFPDGKSIFLDKLLHNEETTVGLCGSDGDFCHIFPQYIFDEDDNICVEIDISDSGEWNLNQLQKSTEERKCLTLHDTNIPLGNITNFGLRNYFKFTISKNGIPTPSYINLFNLKMKLPDGQMVFFDKFMHGDSKYIAFCNKDKSDCYTNPEYRYNIDDEVCLEATLNKWDGDSFVIHETENRASCVQNAENNKFLSEYTAE